MSEHYVIPYYPRKHQADIHAQIESHRFVVLVAHRRLGKTVLAVNQLIKAAITCTKDRPSFAYIAPFRNQAKKIAWAYLRHYSSVIPDTKVNEGELSISFGNGAIIQVFGADNPDALRGIYLDGIVLDEVAQIKPEVWGEIIRPALSDRHGWAVFVGTPKGINLFSQLYDKALSMESKGSPEWKALLYSVNQTDCLPPEEVEAMKQEMSENEFRQEFLCDFNAASDDVLIPIDDVRNAIGRHYREEEYQSSPLVFGVDVARFGSDASVIFKRRGLVAFEPVVYRKFDNMKLADNIARMMHDEKPDAVFIDAGQGQGVIDRLHQLGFNVEEVPFGGAALDEHYQNRRIEMWDQMGQWLRSGGAIPADPLLQSDLSAPTYGYTIGKGQKYLESKDKIKERLGRSPDLADALALTFAAPVMPKISKRLSTQIYGRQERYNADDAFDKQWASM